jgi:thiol:disulfide interchange protein DsbD
MMRPNFFRSFGAVAVAACLWSAPAAASSAVQVDHVALSVAVEAPAKPGTTVWVAIRQVIAPGWHTYWRNPGDTGLATSINWVLPKGIIAGKPLWPAPERFTTGSIVNYGYEKEATLLVPLTVAPDAVIGPARANIFLLECAQMCIPEQATLDLDLRKASPANFAAPRASLPRDFNGSAEVATGPKTLVLKLTNPTLSGVKADAVRFYPATTHTVDYDASPSVRISGNTLTWTAARSPHARPFGKFEGVLEIRGAGVFAISTSPMKSAVSPPAPRTAELSLAEAALLALLGGLILNLMPCVLPILSMKALALTQSGGNLRALRRDGAFYFAGVLATFAVIAGTLLALKAGGAALGWGFQLQSPLVVFALALLMTAIGLNLLGAFEIPLSLAGVGNDLTRGEGGWAAFFTGALAVLVASPCTAPFMGTALGFALTQPPAAAIVVFLALGIGFALPFTAIAFTPALVRLVPRPGPWMVLFKEFLAFPMFATAIWLLWVLSSQVGPAGLAVSLSTGLGLVFLFWLLRFLSPWPRRIVGLIGLAALIALSLDIQSAPAQSEWAPWSAATVTKARAAGKPVLVDFSATWCVTCLVNERVALDDTTVVARLRRDGVVTLKGDWTNRDSAISAELGHYGRSGVPLYLFYPPHGSAVVMPQLLTANSILDLLNRYSHQKV